MTEPASEAARAKMPRRGWVTHETTVWCGGCNEWQQHTSERAIRNVRQDGWKNTRHRGWLCPKCLAKDTK